MTIKQNGGVFGRNPTFNDVTIEGQLTFDGDIDINSDLKVSGDIETTGNVIIATAGKGIDFSATAGAGTSELLDDYEEGTWTPTIGGTGGSAGITYATQTGSYVIIGKVITAQFSVKLSSKGTASGTLVIGGLPVSAVSGECAGIPSYYSNVTLASGSSITLRWPGGSIMAPRQNLSTTVNIINISELNNDFDIRGSITAIIA